MKVIAVTNQKGGVGKTTICYSLARSLASQGNKVLVVDNDPQGNLTESLIDRTEIELTANVMDLYSGVVVQPQKVHENLDLIGANIHLAKIAEHDFEVIFKLKEGIEILEKEYEYIFIDCLPSFGYLNTAATIASDYILIPTEPAQYGMAGVSDLLDSISKIKTRLNQDLVVLGVIFNLVEDTKLCKAFKSLMRETYKELVFDSEITKSVKWKEAVALNNSLLEYAPKSKNAEQLRAVIKELQERLEVK